jgi:hypothetical protein
MPWEVTTNPYQEGFLFSKKRFPAIIAAIGTGKTMFGLMKVWAFCEKYPKSLFMIVRKEYTDLRDSTLRDCLNYFGASFDSNKEYKFNNGSVIMARHGAELAVLKNVNLSGFLIEQAEEFETDEAFIFLRDRLRRQTSPYRQGLIIANARGHNWCWKYWINNAKEVKCVDAKTGQYHYTNKEYEAFTANTFANEHNLPDDFIDDLKQQSIDAPHHYAQYVMNSFEEMEEDDYVFNFADLEASKHIEYAKRDGYGHRIGGFDVARYGNDKSAAVGIQQVGALAWEMYHAEQWDKRDLDYTTGRILAISATNKFDDNIVDEDGIGGGPLDFIIKGHQRNDFQGFRNTAYSKHQNAYYANRRTEAAFKLKEYVAKGWIKITDEETIQELMTLRYKYANDGRRMLIPKEVMRKDGIKSPNLADALLMATSLIGDVKAKQDTMYDRQPMQYYQEESLFKIAGIR